MAQLRLAGETYSQIAQRAGLSRQRIQKLISPPKEIRDFILKKYSGHCAKCGIKVGHAGHIHHKEGNDGDEYNDIPNLELLCISCHRKEHGQITIPSQSIDEWVKELGIKPGDIETYITPEEYAKRYRIHLNTVYNHIKSGEIKAIRIGDQWRIPASALPDAKKA